MMIIPNIVESSKLSTELLVLIKEHFTRQT